MTARSDRAAPAVASPISGRTARNDRAAPTVLTDRAVPAVHGVRAAPTVASPISGETVRSGRAAPAVASLISGGTVRSDRAAPAARIDRAAPTVRSDRAVPAARIDRAAPAELPRAAPAELPRAAPPVRRARRGQLGLASALTALVWTGAAIAQPGAAPTAAAPTPARPAATDEPRLVALVPAADAARVIALGPHGEVYEPDGRGAWIRTRPIATANRLTSAARAGDDVLVFGEGVIFRLADNGWSALRLHQRHHAVMSAGPRGVAAVGRQLFALGRGGEPTKLGVAPIAVQMIGASDDAVTVVTKRGLYRTTGGTLRPLPRAPRGIERLITDRWALVARGAVDLDTGIVTAWPAGATIEAAGPGPAGTLVAVGRTGSRLELFTVARPSAATSRAGRPRGRRDRHPAPTGGPGEGALRRETITEDVTATGAPPRPGTGTGTGTGAPPRPGTTPGTGAPPRPGTTPGSTPGTGAPPRPGTTPGSTPGTGSAPGTGTGTGAASAPGTGTGAASAPGTGTAAAPGTGTAAAPATPPGTSPRTPPGPPAPRSIAVGAAAVGVVVDGRGAAVVALADGRLAVRERGAWRLVEVRVALPPSRPGAAPARAP